MQNGKELILVDLDDRETGTGEKLEVQPGAAAPGVFRVPV